MLGVESHKMVKTFWFAAFIGVIEALLLARLVARLLAARPDNPTVLLLYTLTEPLVAPLRMFNYDQPPFGAALEFSTLVLLSLLPLVGYVLWVWLQRRNSTP